MAVQVSGWQLRLQAAGLSPSPPQHHPQLELHVACQPCGPSVNASGVGGVGAVSCLEAGCPVQAEVVKKRKSIKFSFALYRLGGPGEGGLLPGNAKL